MRHRFAISRATAAFLVLGTVGLLATWLAVPSATEPEYDGQPLSYHLASLTYGDVRRERAAREAVRALGSNAVPHLIRILESRDSKFKTAFNRLANCQSVIRFRFESVAVRQMHAAIACQEIGPAAAPAISALAGLINDADQAQWVIPALAEIGPQTFPLLTHALFDGHQQARIAAAGSLRLVHPPELAVDPLVRALASTETPVRRLAAESLGALGVSSTTVVTALINQLDDPDATVRLAAARSLGWLGHCAVAAVPRLIELYRNEAGSPGQSQFATALVSIDSAAAEKEGVK